MNTISDYITPILILFTVTYTHTARPLPSVAPERTKPWSQKLRTIEACGQQRCGQKRSHSTPHTHIYIHTYIHTYTYIYTYTYTHTYIYIYIYIHTYTYTHIYIYTYIEKQIVPKHHV